MKQKSLVDLCIFIAIFVFLFSYFSPSLLLQNKSVAGGDTASHYYSALFMKDLLIQGRISGFSLDWFAGTPMFRFYFPLPFVIFSILAVIFSDYISFRILTVLGVFLLPLAVYWFFKKLRFRWPAPILAALFSLFFLFLESHSTFGGNILSVLSGEIAYSLSILFLLGYFGSLYAFIENKKNKYFILATVFFVLVILCHFYSALIALFGSLFFIFTKEKREFKKKGVFLLKLFILVFLLSGFFVIPFVVRAGYMTSMNWQNVRSIGLLFPKNLILIYFFALFAGVRHFKDKRIKCLLFLVFLGMVLFLVAPAGQIYNARFLPFVYLFMVLISSIFFAQLVKKRKQSVVQLFVLVLILFLVFSYIFISVKKAPIWINWNYEGFEDKENQEFLEVAEYLRELPDGRVFYEFSDSHSEFGTTRAFELLPVFSEKQVLEGLLLESSISSEFHYIMQSELSEQGSCPILETECFELSEASFLKGIEHLKLFNIRYFIATSESVKQFSKQSTELRFLRKFENLEIYELNQTGYVESVSIKFESEKNWKQKSREWFVKSDLKEILVFSDAESSRTEEAGEECEIQETKITNQEIVFKTKCIGKPHLVKVSYFPNWNVHGAERVYLASPSFMVVFPDSQEIKLTYENSGLEYFAVALSLVGLLVLVVLIARSIKTYKNR